MALAHGLSIERRRIERFGCELKRRQRWGVLQLDASECDSRFRRKKSASNSNDHTLGRYRFGGPLYRMVGAILVGLQSHDPYKRLGA